MLSIALRQIGAIMVFVACLKKKNNKKAAQPRFLEFFFFYKDLADILMGKAASLRFSLQLQLQCWYLVLFHTLLYSQKKKKEKHQAMGI